MSIAYFVDLHSTLAGICAQKNKSSLAKDLLPTAAIQRDMQWELEN